MPVKEQKIEIKKWFNYRWIVKNVPYFLFLSVLAVVYIANGHYADNNIRNINLVTKQIKEQEYEYKSLRGRLMFQSRLSEVAKAVEPLGLKENIQQPVKITDTLRTVQTWR